MLVKTTGHEKLRFTAVLTCIAEGTKLRPMVILKQRKLPKPKFPKGLVVLIHENYCMDKQGMRIWLKQVWFYKWGGFRKENFYWSGICLNVISWIVLPDIAVVPGGLTSIVQDTCQTKRGAIEKQYLINVNRCKWRWTWIGKRKKNNLYLPKFHFKKQNLYINFMWFKIYNKSL